MQESPLLVRASSGRDCRLLRPAQCRPSAVAGRPTDRLSQRASPPATPSASQPAAAAAKVKASRCKSAAGARRERVLMQCALCACLSCRVPPLLSLLFWRRARARCPQRKSRLRCCARHAIESAPRAGRPLEAPVECARLANEQKLKLNNSPAAAVLGQSVCCTQSAAAASRTQKQTGCSLLPLTDFVSRRRAASPVHFTSVRLPSVGWETRQPATGATCFALAL